MSEKGTEQGSQHHKEKARKQGDVVRSRELVSAAAMLAGVLAFGAVAAGFVSAWRVAFERTLAASGSSVDWLGTVHAVLAPAVVPVAGVLLASFAAALATGLAQGGGLTLHPGALSPKFGRLNPFSNVAQMFSLRAGTRVAKSLVPAAAMVAFGWSSLRALMQPMPVLSAARLPHALAACYTLAVEAACITLGWSGLDYAVEWVSWNKRMRMTKQQLKDESKEQQGNPHTKGRIRQVQNSMRRRKVKADMSRASVVITNPTHYAVALEFSFETMQAPRVLAKGRDLHAAEIREAARWNNVPLVENPPLARSLYRAVEPGQSIPFELYSAVAGILAWLYRQKMEDAARAERMRAAHAQRAEAQGAR